MSRRKRKRKPPTEAKFQAGDYVRVRHGVSDEDYDAFNLTRVLCHADPVLLVHRDSQIIESRNFCAGLRDSFLERIEILSWDDATCWRELEAVCEEGKDKQHSNKVDLDRARHILEALARSGSQCENKVHEAPAMTPATKGFMP